MTTCQEIGIETRVVKKGLEDDGLIAGLSHVPYTTSASFHAWVLVSVVLDIDLGGRVLGPNRSTFYQMSVSEKHNVLSIAELPGTHHQFQTFQTDHGFCPDHGHK